MSTFRKPVSVPTDLPPAAFPSLTTANPAAYEQLQTGIPRHRRIFQFLVSDLAEHVAERLTELGRNARWLAQKLGKQDSEISRWLSGAHNLTLESVAKLSDALEEDLLVSPRFPLGFFSQSRPVVESVAQFTTTSALDWRGGSYNPAALPATMPVPEAEDYSYGMAA